MEQKETEIFPRKHIDSYDGMSVTADVWNEAHSEHRHAGRAHNLAFHGAGIVYGLEVAANDPPNNLVFISPGVAVDSAGYVVELQEPVAYDFGDSNEGELYLVIGHGERSIGGVDSDVRYLQDEFVVAALTKMPTRPAVEIARIRIEKPGKPILNPENPLYPKTGELDLRFRNEIGPKPHRAVQIGMINLGGKLHEEVLSGWEKLARQSENLAGPRLMIDHDPQVIKKLPRYDMLYLSGAGAFKVGNSDLEAIREFYQGGGSILLEALDQAGGESCQALVQELGVKLEPAEPGDDMLEFPYLFAEVPEGLAGGAVSTAERFIFSSSAYSLLWIGHKQGEALSREEIRSSHEWGLNMVQGLLRH